MFSRFVTAAARSAPSVNADGSLKLPPSTVVLTVVAEAGVGVDGTSVVGFETGAGAAGGAGVEATAGAGVDGGGAEDEAVLEEAGAVLGCVKVRFATVSVLQEIHTLVTIHTMKPFSSILYDSTVFASCRILPRKAARVSTNLLILIQH